MHLKSIESSTAITIKSILSKLKVEDRYFGIGYNMNLYRGCQHGCIYCDTRSDCYGLGDISQIKVKQNAIELLGRELADKKRVRRTIGTGSMNDPYMPVEKELGLTRRALETIANFRFPVHIITKSNLVTRDLDVINQIGSVYSAVSLTITTTDDHLSRRIEPFAPESSRRFEAISMLAKHGIYAGITMMPLLPYITDTIQNIKELLLMAKESGASYVIPMFGVTLRPGSREYFYNSLRAGFPSIKEQYVSSFRDSYECWLPDRRRIEQIFYSEVERLGIATRMKFYHPHTPKQLSLL